MKFDFKTIIDRKGKEARGYDKVGLSSAPSLPKEGFDIIPMWVSDMDFAVSDSIQESLKERIEHPIYGYFDIPDKFYESIIYWHKARKNTNNIEKKHISHDNELLGGLVSGLKALNKKGDAVLLHKPTYIGFVDILSSLGYEIILSDLKEDKDGIFRMDYDDMSKKIKDYNIKTAIICSPHNPLGRIWEKWELEKLSDVLEENNCKAISDEIWSDITINDNVHIPTANGSEYLKNNTIGLYSPNKTFNLAGLNISYSIIYNDEIRSSYNKAQGESFYNAPNLLSIYALYGGYCEEGLEWNLELNKVLSKNINYVCDFIEKKFDGVNYTKPEGTYIVFMDCEKWLDKNGKNMDELLKLGYDYGIGWSDGRPFNAPFGIRINLGLPFEKVEEVMQRMDKYIFNA